MTARHRAALTPHRSTDPTLQSGLCYRRLKPRKSNVKPMSLKFRGMHGDGCAAPLKAVFVNSLVFASHQPGHQRAGTNDLG